MKKLLILFALLIALTGCAANATEEENADVITPEVESDEEDARIGPYPGYTSVDFELGTLDGDKIKLSDLQGKPVQMVFWTTTCPYCKAELDELVEVKSELGDKVEIIAINITGSDIIDEVRRIAEEKNLNFPVLLDMNNEVTAEYLVRGVPVNVFIKPDGVIASYYTGKLDKEFVLEQLNGML